MKIRLLNEYEETIEDNNKIRKNCSQSLIVSGLNEAESDYILRILKKLIRKRINFDDMLGEPTTNITIGDEYQPGGDSIDDILEEDISIEDDEEVHRGEGWDGYVGHRESYEVTTWKRKTVKGIPWSKDEEDLLSFWLKTGRGRKKILKEYRDAYPGNERTDESIFRKITRMRKKMKLEKEEVGSSNTPSSGILINNDTIFRIGQSVRIIDPKIDNSFKSNHSVNNSNGSKRIEELKVIKITPEGIIIGYPDKSSRILVSRSNLAPI